MTELGTCFTACCCPCCIYGRNKSRMEGKESCVTDCCLYSCLTMCGICFILGASTRGSIRNKYGIHVRYPPLPWLPGRRSAPVADLCCLL